MPWKVRNLKSYEWAYAETMYVKTDCVMNISVVRFPATKMETYSVSECSGSNCLKNMAASEVHLQVHPFFFEMTTNVFCMCHSVIPTQKHLPWVFLGGLRGCLIISLHLCTEVREQTNHFKRKFFMGLQKDQLRLSSLLPFHINDDFIHSLHTA